MCWKKFGKPIFKHVFCVSNFVTFEQYVSIKEVVFGCLLLVVLTGKG